jgi:acyl-CoA reductase-like NAD-dependent aldehyde dehydrogenase
MTLTTTDPATGDVLAEYRTHTDDEIDGLLARAHAAAAHWGKADLDERRQVLERFAAVLRQEADRLAALVTAEMGKVLAEARAEVEKCAVTCDYYAAHARAMLADEPVSVDGAVVHVAYEPIGLVLAVMPWNFPLWQAVRFAAPALVAGNGALLKHSPNVTGCALALQDLLEKAGLPTGVFTTLVVEEERVPEVTERIIADDRVAAVTLTGSNRAGAEVGALAGRHVKKAVLELGGSDAFVVLADADVEAAARAAVQARFHNAGQSCICSKRFIVEDAVHDAFLAAFVQRVEELVVGDPRDPATTTGPMARGDLREQLHHQVRHSVDRGATVLTGGEPLSGCGFGYAPTVMTAAPGMPVFDEETFGPVAAVVRASDAADAMRLAGATEFGLGLSIWTSDTARAHELARGVITGAVFVNAVVASDPRVPFGGTKRSGFGRELSVHGLREFVNVRTFWTVEADSASTPSRSPLTTARAT